jgi:hypothetical protein
MNVKPWQIIVIVLGLLIGVGSVVYMLATTDGPRVKTIMYLVDVETGELYRADLEKLAVALPGQHPISHRTCLVRIIKDDSGKWVVGKRDRGLFAQLDKDVQNKAVDPETGELLMPAKTPVEYAPVKKAP